MPAKDFDLYQPACHRPPHGGALLSSARAVQDVVIDPENLWRAEWGSLHG